MLKQVVVILSLAVIHNDAAKILGVFHFPSKSHHILGNSLMQALASKGHQVTMMSPFSEPNSKNYEHIELTGSMELIQNTSLQKILVKDHEMSMLKKFIIMHKNIGLLDEFSLNHTAMKTILSSNRQFDLVIIVYFGNDAFLGIANHFNAASVVFSTLGSSVITDGVTGNPAPYSYVPNKFFPLTERMNFWQRMTNFVGSMMYHLYFNFVSASVHDHLLQQHFPNSPGRLQLRKNISLVLLNSHFSTESPRPHLPNMIQVGGLHISDSAELSEEYQHFLDTAEHGVIFFSLGSNIQISALLPETITTFITVFSKLRQKVLWKFEKEPNYPNFPKNVKVAKWFPQSTILAHPNLKVFVTHAGALSTTEAVHHGVPMVVMPMFGDQRGNALEAVNKGFAVVLDFHGLSEDVFMAAIQEVLTNKKYKEAVKAASRIIKDQPIKPLDNAVYWIEYVLRHKGAHHLKSSAMNLSWYQYYLLDVVCFLLGITVILFVIVLHICRLIKYVFVVSKRSSVNKFKSS